MDSFSTWLTSIASDSVQLKMHVLSISPASGQRKSLPVTDYSPHWENRKSHQDSCVHPQDEES